MGILKPEAKVKARVSMEPVVIPRNPIGPDGKPRTEDEMRPYSLGKQVVQTIEVDYEAAVELWGEETADELFKKGVKDAE
jgi:hypothetical protein